MKEGLLRGSFIWPGRAGVVVTFANWDQVSNHMTFLSAELNEE